MINVTKTFLPPVIDFHNQVATIWKNEWLTNNGELLQELDFKLKEYLNINYLTLMTNGTLPIQIALKILANKGEVITTPFSYVATTSSIVWENCVPVFVDINPEYLTIDETKIEAAITPETTTILATHVFGNPCNVEVIDAIAKKHNLKVIYDAAHCFGVTYNNTSIFNYGDISTCSFHATKLFHTGEGGAAFCQSLELSEEINRKHNFGHISKTDFDGVGINAKMSELQAAMGLCVLPYINDIILDRQRVFKRYMSKLNWVKIKSIKIRKNTEWNYSYFPVIFNSENDCLNVLNELKSCEIYPRRYFYPSLDSLEYINSNSCKVSTNISKRILCLPIFYLLDNSIIDKISDKINFLID